MEILSKRGRWWVVGAILAALLLSQSPAWPSQLEALAVVTMSALGLAGAYLLPRPRLQPAPRRVTRD